jgi:hypothetical protein
MQKPVPASTVPCGGKGKFVVKNAAEYKTEQSRISDEVGEKAVAFDEFRTISLKSIAELLDATRSSARRWLKQAGIRPIALGRGPKGAIRYRWLDVQAWLESREHVD